MHAHLHQAPPNMGFSRQECWSGLPCPTPGDLPNPRVKPWSPALQADSLPLSYQRSPIYKLLDIILDISKKSLRSDQIRLVAQSCLTLCNPMNRSTPILNGNLDIHITKSPPGSLHPITFLISCDDNYIFPVFLSQLS